MTNTIDLDKLEQVARAAGGQQWRDTGLSIRVASDEPSDTLVWWYDFEGDTKPEHRDHVVAANPAVILELVRRLRAAEADAARYKWLCRKAYTETAFDRYPGYKYLIVIFDDKCVGLEKVIDAERAAQGASHD